MTGARGGEKAWVQAWRWYREGWSLFSKNRVSWVLFTALWGLWALVLWQIPLIGRIAWWIINPALYAGFVYGAAQLRQGRALELEHLVRGLSDGRKRTHLLTLGVITLAGYAFLSIVTSVGESLGVEPLSAGGEGVGSLAIAINVSLEVALFALILVLVAMALFYSCPAIMLEDERESFESMMLSFETCIDHWRPFAAFVAVFLGLSLVALLPLGLGFLVLIPVTGCAAYVSYDSLYRPTQTT